MKNILYCNLVLAERSGTEIVTIDTVLGLHRRDFKICLYASIRGESSRALTDHGILVAGDLNDIPWRPDLIHSNHIVESLEAAAWFPDTPQVHLCHDPDIWFSSPPRLSLVRRWLAVDEMCAERIRRETPLATEVLWMPNAVDLATHPLRDALPPRPKRALILTKNSGYFDEVASACMNAGVQLDQLGPGAGVVVADLPQYLQRYDIVFATARMAIEAMACGCAVVVVDARGLAGLVTSANVGDWRRHNFGRRLLTRAVTADALSGELAQYDLADARTVSSYIREHAALSGYLDALVDVYRGAIDDFARAPTDPRITLRETVAALRGVLSKKSDATIYDTVQELASLRGIVKELAPLRGIVKELASLKMELATCRSELAAMQDMRRKPLKRLLRTLRSFAGNAR